jgi:hypothetical protein
MHFTAHLAFDNGTGEIIAQIQMEVRKLFLYEQIVIFRKRRCNVRKRRGNAPDISQSLVCVSQTQLITLYR